MTQKIKERLEQAAETAWEQDQQTNPTPVNPYAYVYGFKAGAQTILENPGEWGLMPISNDREWGSTVNRIIEEKRKYREALEDVIIRLEEDKRFSALSIAKEALKQEVNND